MGPFSAVEMLQKDNWMKKDADQICLNKTEITNIKVDCKNSKISFFNKFINSQLLLNSLQLPVFWHKSVG